MKKIENPLEVISGVVTLQGKVVIDVGCGTGDLVRAMVLEGARVTGIDTLGMLEKAKEHAPAANEEYLPGSAEKLPFKNKTADVIVYFASLHHVPMEKMNKAIQEMYRVLKPGGIVVFLEPVAKSGSYFELTRLVEDEREVQRHAYKVIKGAVTLGMEMMEEQTVYCERSFDDYVNLLNTFIDNEASRERYLVQSRAWARQLCREAGVDLKDYRFKSICRINVLKKKE
jgi:ubiquinone/menaquinone biosynthesis C-methylase UbiE